VRETRVQGPMTNMESGNPEAKTRWWETGLLLIWVLGYAWLLKVFSIINRTETKTAPSARSNAG
jgi:hypothetical protein